MVTMTPDQLADCLQAMADSVRQGACSEGWIEYYDDRHGGLLVRGAYQEGPQVRRVLGRSAGVTKAGPGREGLSPSVGR